MIFRSAICLFAFILLGGFVLPGGDTQPLCSGKFITVTSDGVLYKNEKTKQFLVKFKVVNVSKKTIGVYLDYEFDAIYPHQYGIYDTAASGPVREIRLHCDYKAHKDSIDNKLEQKFAEKKLKMLEPKQIEEYYVPMEIHVDDHDIKKHEYLVITCDGHMYSTDGKSVAHDCLLKVSHKKRGITFGHPLKFSALPVNADVIEAH